MRVRDISILCIAGTLAFAARTLIAQPAAPQPAGLIVTQDAGRTAFVRMEEKAWVGFSVRNDTGRPVRNVQAHVAFGAAAEPEHAMALADLPPGASAAVAVPVDTRLRPDAYHLRVSVAGRAGETAVSGDGKAVVTIVPRPLPDRMPVMFWGAGAKPGDRDILKEIGFTHYFCYDLADYQRIWSAGAPTGAGDPARVAAKRRQFDDNLANGLLMIPHLYPASLGLGQMKADGAALQKQWQRVDREGRPYSRPSICAAEPALQKFVENVGASVSVSYGDHPDFAAALLHSEVRDSTNLCFHDFDKAAYRAFSGRDIPAGVTSKNGVRYDTIRDFPANRIVKDDDPLLAYLRWFWKTGDGWNDVETLLSRGLHTRAHPGFWTFTDPATRAPSLWGSGGKVDVINTWTYVYPDPINIGETTDEMFAMADGAPGQKVMSMTQIIWRRSESASRRLSDPARAAAWESDAKAQYITIPPDCLREAAWSVLARPVGAIAFYGWGSLVSGAGGSYSFTNPETRPALTELIHDVILPLGPTLVQAPDRPADVAMLESFASQMYAGRGTYGWGNKWETDMHLVLQWAKLQPRIIYEETILRDGLDAFKVLAMPNCDVLPQSVFDRIKAFQARGGILVADENLAPALTPDIILKSFRRTRHGQQDKEALQKLAAELRTQLDAAYERYGDASDADTVIRFRRYGEADYLFALNDKRTFGDYVGQHGMVMEKGLPNTSTLSVKRPNAAVYDLLAHRAVATQPTKDGVEWTASFGPAEGRLYMILDRPIKDVLLAMPPHAAINASATVSLSVRDGVRADNKTTRRRAHPAVVGQFSQGRPVSAIVPMKLEILDPQGRPAEGSGYYGAKDGQLSVTLDFAPNDLPGVWTLRWMELASGLKGETPFRVREAGR